MTSYSDIEINCSTGTDDPTQTITLTYFKVTIFGSFHYSSNHESAGIMVCPCKRMCNVGLF